MKLAFAALLPAFALTACGGPKEVTVDHGWVRLPVVAGRPAAAYFTLHGGKAGAILIQVSSPDAKSAQMHESMEMNGVSSMAPLTQVAAPAGGSIKFEPGGKHVMLFGLAPAIHPGGPVRLHFTFANGQSLDYAAKAIPATAPAPGD
ncbi:MAG: copper chaperone PCu(A)C [Sphingomonas sp.]